MMITFYTGVVDNLTLCHLKVGKLCIFELVSRQLTNCNCQIINALEFTIAQLMNFN